MKKHTLFISVLVFVLALALTAPTAIAKDMTGKDFVIEAKKGICEISVSDAKALLDKGGYVFLVLYP